MINPNDSQEQLKKYFNKLSRIIMEHNRGFFSRYKIIDKLTIDDIICCIDASFPDEYKAYIKSRDSAKIASWKYYKQLIPMVKRKPLFGSNKYAVDDDKAIVIIRAIVKALDSDFRIIFQEYN